MSFNKDYNVVDYYTFLKVLPFMLGPELKGVFHMGPGMGRSITRYNFSSIFNIKYISFMNRSENVMGFYLLCLLCIYQSSVVRQEQLAHGE